MSGKRKTCSSDAPPDHGIPPFHCLPPYEEEEQDPHVIEEKSWLAKEACSSYQITETPTNAVFPTAEQRLLLFDWLREVCTDWKHHVQTWYLACNYVDRYILSKHSNKWGLHKGNYQLLGVTCLWIAAKLEEVWSQSIDEVVQMTDHCCTVQQVIRMEYSIIEVLYADFRPPTLYAWMEHHKTNSLKMDPKMQFVLHCIQLDPAFATYFPSQLARVLIDNQTSHALYSRIERYRTLYDQHKTVLQYNEKRELIETYGLDKWKEWLEIK